MTSTGAGWVPTGHGDPPQPLRPVSRCACGVPTLWTTTPHGVALWPVSPLLATIPRPRPHRNRTRLVGYFWAFWVCFGRSVRSAYSARAYRSLRCFVCGHALSPCAELAPGVGAGHDPAAPVFSVAYLWATPCPPDDPPPTETGGRFRGWVTVWG